MDEGVEGEVSYVDRRLAKLREEGFYRDQPQDYLGPRLVMGTQKRYKYPPGTTERPCTRCNVVKSVDDFPVYRFGALGRGPKCKACLREIGKEYTRADRERRAGRPRPEVCECCGESPRRQRPLHWDHDHKTGTFRGWICHDCNIGIGGAKDDVDRLRKMISYLERTR
jgi:hypothetical protein